MVGALLHLYGIILDNARQKEQNVLMTTASSTASLFLNDTDGRICCAQHGGIALRMAHTARPNKPSYDTPLGLWTRWTIIDENNWRRMTGSSAGCETCGIGI